MRTQHPDVLRRVSALHVCPYGRPFQSPINGQLEPMYMTPKPMKPMMAAIGGDDLRDVLNIGEQLLHGV
ncbi:MAG: hypothetical protein HC828_06135 [Blastochloris sp.]|nr:hypothetical protein [Blastochloris sp.]